MKRLATLSAKLLANQIRREKFEGRDHLVAPVVAVVEKVLNGELLPAEEIEASLLFWEGVPVPLDHPVDENGDHVSANGREVLEEQVIGRFFGAFFEEAALKGELWIDLEKARGVEGGREAVDRLERAERGGDLVEVSTAYFREVEDTEGEFEGEPFDGVQRNLRPDHLAILLEKTGACSIDDGCGAPRRNEEEEEMNLNVRGTARRPSFQGTETSAWTGPTLGRMIDGWIRHGGGSEPDSRRAADLPAAAKRWIASKTLLGDPAADNERDLTFFPVVNPNTNRLNAGALRAVLGGRGAQARIPASARESAQNMARRLLETQFESSSNSLRKALATLGAALGFNSEEEMNREKLISALVAFACCPLSKESLEALTDEELKALHEKAEKETKAAESAGSEEGASATGNEAGEAAGKKPAEEGGDGEGKKPEPKENEDAISAEDRELLKTLRKIGPENLERIASEATAEREEVIAALVKNDACTIAKEDLEKMPTPALLEVKRMLTPADYSGAGGPFARQSGDDGKPPAAPAVVLAANEDDGEKKKKEE